MKNYNTLRLALQLVAIIALMACVTMCVYMSWYILVLPISLCAIGVAVLVVHHQMNAQRKIAILLDAVDNEDLTFRFSQKGDRVLNSYFERIKDMILSARVNAREQERYFECIIEQSNIGVIIVNTWGVVTRINEPALSMLQLPRLTHLRGLSAIDPEAGPKVLAMTQGTSHQVRFYSDSSEVKLNIECSEMTLQGNDVKVLIVNDISKDLKNTEIDSWHRISRVLTHEIMNSLSPITSLSQSLLNSTDPAYITKGLQIIASTSDSLLIFVENYRKLTKISKPIPQEFDLIDLVRKESQLISPSIRVTSKEEGAPHRVYADSTQLSQVVINLLKNGVDATQGIPGAKVWVDIFRGKKGEVVMEVCNNGERINENIREDIFVPFFTTKEGGSGIGLSLSRQIMRQHEGALTLLTEPHTRFRISFPLQH